MKPSPPRRMNGRRGATFGASSLGTGALLVLACSGAPARSTPVEPPAGAAGAKAGAEEPESPFQSFVLPIDAAPPADVTNKFADNPDAAALGKKFFFDTRFSGPLLDDTNNGTEGTLGVQGEAGKVACTSCHSPEGGVFADERSPRGQLSLASGWTHRKAPSLLNSAESKFLMWDGRRDSGFSQIFTPLESPLEFNSSRLFVAQQIYRLYRKEYEALFGKMPALLDDYPVLDPSEAGCSEMPEDPVHDQCTKDGTDDAVTRVVVNMGKAIQAYTRTFTCGRGRFDDWVEGDSDALTADEQAGAELFVGKAGCSYCHWGSYFRDGRFHNVGLSGGLVPFTGVATFDDPGAAPAVDALLTDPLNSRGKFSDGDDDRLDSLPADMDSLKGAFRTASLRCVSRRRTFMHNGQFRSLEDVVDFFNKGGDKDGYVGTSEISPLDLNETERAQLVAFLKALDGDGPPTEVLEPPTLP